MLSRGILNLKIYDDECIGEIIESDNSKKQTFKYKH